MESRDDNGTENRLDECHLAFRDGIYQVRMFPFAMTPVDVNLHGVSTHSDALKVLDLFKLLKFG